MEVLVSTTAASAPLSSARVHRRPLTRSVAFRAPGRRGWRCRSAAPTRPDPVPSEEPASASGSATATTVVTDKPDAPAAEEKSGEVSGGFVEEIMMLLSRINIYALPMGWLIRHITSVVTLDIQVTPTSVILGGGALIALLVLSKIISAIDSVPLLPNVLEIVGTGYSVWFITRYLLFKESRDELFAKFEDLKNNII
uniref:Cyanobacterial aminoacyl-tRNA synthetase CAAD domain-containing protein n=1 Tax=Aegilops tauschii TaxID=37682 RepID=M8AV37_AEGTA